MYKCRRIRLVINLNEYVWNDITASNVMIFEPDPFTHSTCSMYVDVAAGRASPDSGVIKMSTLSSSVHLIIINKADTLSRRFVCNKFSSVSCIWIAVRTWGNFLFRTWKFTMHGITTYSQLNYAMHIRLTLTHSTVAPTPRQLCRPRASEWVSEQVCLSLYKFIYWQTTTASMAK